MGGKILNYEAKDILNQGRAEGRAEGRAKGRAEGHTEGIVQATLSSIRNLMTKMHMTAAEAMNILEVPASEQEKYASQL